ncbi:MULTISPECIES: phytanoyl-CoA dioxygenase family protein [Photorhabdus]|uniref:Phytanoyl-CoA dioxygenase n=1 Tax=Photorhabdus kayaii TaxID=230088 RepID=A0ABX0B1I5_9GAMM|nr:MULTISPECIES: phytanoyl-CoA dioxygenase family protein [Photorhabdus]MCC8375882.1 phytanoyl-CoA dioxygenase family protein [Photorhabdus bodei]MCT8352470.1 phytanoyl-CoA dioxygenase family protein [Photorhabdus kayaii]NDL13178.1 phytanoyl-CoA dioxygenase [Photorhabdus kayaii]NDL26972.1 phytanoyl-CoA dioxygenase [Photorhabdus kayaii]RAX08375.1 phytanoyl-CoA dioxygenase [Photorhabdus sp. HUG-39]
MNFKEKMQEMGYVVIPEAIEKEEIEIIRNFYKETSNINNLSTLLPTDILKNTEVFHAILNDKSVTVIKEIFGKSFSLFPNFTIRESVYIPWHNDAYFLSDEVINLYAPLQFMQCAIYLQDNDPEYGGGITLIPFSHRLNQTTVKKMLNTPQAYEKVIMSKAGDLILWDNRITHRSTYPDKAPDNTKLALQWTVSASKQHNELYLQYLRDRAQHSMHVSDYLPKSPKPYFADMPNVRYPDSFHQDSLKIMKTQNIHFIGL